MCWRGGRLQVRPGSGELRPETAGPGQHRAEAEVLGGLLSSVESGRLAWAYLKPACSTVRLRISTYSPPLPFRHLTAARTRSASPPSRFSSPRHTPESSAPPAASRRPAACPPANCSSSCRIP